MKKIMFASAMALACLAISCNDPKTGVDDAAFKKAKADNAAVYTAMETGDVSKLKDLIAKDAVDHNGNMDGSDIAGVDSIVAMMSKMHTCFEPGAKFTITSQAMDGDLLYTMTDFKGKTSANPGPGMPPNTEMNWKTVDVTKNKDGKITDHWGFMSMKDVTDWMKMAAPHGGPGMPPPGDGKMPPPPPGDKMMKDTMRK